jgi:hypothetical protein
LRGSALARYRELRRAEGFAVVRWLVYEGYNIEAARAFVRSGWVPFGVMTGGRFYENIEAAGVMEPSEEE